ncbi:MAG: hypothetical protein HY901_01680 [Deltaproteobacteria bacterium]|nr:hypothetical protein [Deltaproteobacteria bacterium]
MSVASISESGSLGSIGLGRGIASSTRASESDAAPTDVSKMGETMKQLQQLKEGDRSKFKEVMARISEKFEARASEATGRKADFLQALADKFQHASESGDMSALRPPPPPAGRRPEDPPPADARVAAYGTETTLPPAPEEELTAIIQATLQEASSQ